MSPPPEASRPSLARFRLLVAAAACVVTAATLSSRPASASPSEPFPGSTRSHYLAGTGTAALHGAGLRDAADAVRGWLAGYLGATTRPFVDVGACTCPPLARLPAGWALADLAAVATAAGRGVVVPQIYANAGGNATEWAALARWASAHHHPA